MKYASRNVGLSLFHSSLFHSLQLVTFELTKDYLDHIQSAIDAGDDTLLADGNGGTVSGRYFRNSG